MLGMIEVLGRLKMPSILAAHWQKEEGDNVIYGKRLTTGIRLTDSKQ